MRLSRHRLRTALQEPLVKHILGPFRFNQDSGWSLTSPYTEAGAVGSLILAQNDGAFSIRNGRLVVPAQSITPNEIDLCLKSSQITRNAGYAVIGTITRSVSGSDGCRIGWASGQVPGQNTNYLHAIIFGGGTLLVIRNRAGGQSYITLTNASLDTDYQIAIILRSNGAFLCIKGGSYVDWTLIWVFDQSNANPYPFMSNFNSVAKFDDYSVVRFRGAWSTDYGIATNRVASAISNEVTIMEANGIIECTWTPQAGETLSIMFRRTDDDNTLRLDCSQTGGTIKLYTRTGGVDTEINTGKTQTWTIGNPYRIVIDANETTIRTHVEDVLKHNITSSIQQSATGVKVTLPVTNLVCWPKTVQLPGSFGTYISHTDVMAEPPSGSHQFMTLGDSKTFVGVFQPIMIANLGNTYYETVRVDVNGAKIAGIASVINARLAATYEWANPEWVLMNIGVNDVNGIPLTTEASFKASYLTVIDAIHTKYPSAKIYLAKVWSRGKTTEFGSVNTWISDIISSRSDFCYAGIDETVYLENGDDGAAYTTDGVHPNNDGYALTATQWASVAGMGA